LFICFSPFKDGRYCPSVLFVGNINNDFSLVKKKIAKMQKFILRVKHPTGTTIAPKNTAQLLPQPKEQQQLIKNMPKIKKNT